MPIYAYKCDSCGFAKDVLQKISDPVLQDCPECGKPTFSKQLTAAGFQLKGSGWYATDFKGAGSAASATAVGGTSTTTAAEPAVSSTSAAKPDAAPTAACSPGCGCHS
jgi:putative FmdB family regulatory protein